jgi:hypothetical protein
MSGVSLTILLTSIVNYSWRGIFRQGQQRLVYLRQIFVRMRQATAAMRSQGSGFRTDGLIVLNSRISCIHSSSVGRVRAPSGAPGEALGRAIERIVGAERAAEIAKRIVGAERVERAVRLQKEKEKL